jgi:hypothetical protein
MFMNAAAGFHLCYHAITDRLSKIRHEANTLAALLNFECRRACSRTERRKRTPMQIRQDNNIITTYDGKRDRLAVRTIYGLNIFARNGLQAPAMLDPRLVFLKCLTDEMPCSAHIGAIALSDMMDAPEELFGCSGGSEIYSRTSVEYHDGFTDLSGSHYFKACFFPAVPPGLWEASLNDGGGDMEYIIRCHSLALYIGVSQPALSAMRRLLEEPFPGEEQWLRETTGIYPIVLVTGHDGDHFIAYATSDDRFQMLDRARERACEFVRSSEWFQRYRSSLAWDTGEMCLMPR